MGIVRVAVSKCKYLVIRDTSFEHTACYILFGSLVARLSRIHRTLLYVQVYIGLSLFCRV